MKAPNGYGGISKLPGRRRKPFVVRLTTGHNEKGYPIYKVLGYFHTRTEAMLSLAEYHKSPVNLDLQGITIEQVFIEALKESKNLTESSKTIYKSAFNKYISSIKDKAYKTLNLAIMQRIVDDCPKPSPRKQIKKVLALTDVYALEHDIINKGYAQFIKIADSDSIIQKQKKVFSYEDIKKLWKKHGEGDKIASVILVYLYTGFRREELRNLKKENIELGCFRGGSKTKAGKNRLVPIHSAIRSFILNLSDDEYILPSFTRRAKFFTFEFQNYCETELGTRHIVHECRHTFITELNRRRGDPICINRIVGHSSGNIGQDVYTHKTIEELSKCIELVIYE